MLGEHENGLTSEMSGREDIEDQKNQIVLLKKDGKPVIVSDYPVCVYFVVALYLLVAFLLMFNTLVAMMNTTYSTVEEDAKRRWKLERVRIVCSIEGTQFNKTRHKYWAEDKDGDYFLLLRRLKKE